MASSHSGKVAVITGAAAGIGQAYARRLAADGAEIVVADAQAGDTTVRLVQAAGGSAVAVRCDVSKPAEVAALAQAVDTQFGRCDILVNNAGVYPIQMFDDMTFEDWRRLMAINLDAQFLTIKAFAAGMRRRRWGRIVNMASDTFLSNLTGFAHYIASKGGVIGLTRALASEFGEDGVTVNAIAPGLVRTPGTIGRRRRPGRDEVRDEFEVAAGHQSIKRSLVPDDLVGTLSFLTSDDAAFITGQTLYVNGGKVYA
ncbi:MAG: SDR family NAD(P)-dependent oxidoreductase [Xanthobacteraceae bacterium]